MAIDYVDLGTFWHKLDPRTKLIWTLAVIVTLVVWTDPLWGLIPLILIVIPGVIARTPWGKVWAFLKWLLPFMFLTMFLMSVTYSPTLLKYPEANKTIFEIGPLRGTLGGFLYSISFTEKMIFAIILISVLTFSTPFTDILYTLQKYGVPYQLTFIVATAWRLVPMFQNLFNEIVSAQRARAWESESGSSFHRIRKMVPALAPLYNQAINQIERMALAMESRAFGASKKVTVLKEFKWTIGDYIVVAVCVVIIVLAVATAVMGYGML